MTGEESDATGVTDDPSPFVDSRTVQESNGGYTVSIPKPIVENHGIEEGDEVLWMDVAEGDAARLYPPSINPLRPGGEYDPSK